MKADDKLIRKYHRQKPQQEEPKRHQKRPETKPLRRPATLIGRIRHEQTLRPAQALARGKAMLGLKVKGYESLAASIVACFN